MGSDNHKGAINFSGATAKNFKKRSSSREEISMELVEQGFLKPKHEPMTSNHRKKSESEKSYKS